MAVQVATPRASDGTLRENLVIPQGAAWSHTWSGITDGYGQPIALDGWKVRAQIRDTPDATTVLFEWNSVAGQGLGAASAAGNVVTIALTGAESILWPFRRGAYDLYLFDPNGVPTRLVKGSVTIDPAVTR